MTEYRLVAPRAGALGPPLLDSFQQAVVNHEAGPLLVLAGPGTGKTTTLVEAIVDRVERRSVAPESVLALTFSRKAAEQLRDRVAARLGRTMGTSLASTFHSFAYGLLRAHGPKSLYDEPLRLLTAPEQDLQLRELLEGARETDTWRWPVRLSAAVRTRGFAREVAAVLARAREKGLDPADLARLAVEADRDDWLAAAYFMEDYLTNLDFGAALDYPELIHRATRLAAEPEVRSALRAQYSWVFVDEFQDTDPRQSALLQAIAGDGRNLVVVGDPDQSVYAFRGAEVRNLLDFPDRFRDRGGKPAAVLPLGTTRRFGPHLLAASRRLARGIPTLGAVGADKLRDFRSPEPATGHAGDDRVEVRLFTSARAETDHVADLLRRAHLEEGLAWSDMAVLVRSGTASIPGLRRALLAAGVPVEVAGDEVPLVAEPSVAPLLAALQAAVDLDAVTVEQAHYLLTSPLGGLDAAELRSLGRQLRVQDRELATDERAPLPSGELVRRVLLRPGDLLDLPGRPSRTATRVEQLAGVLAEAAAQVARGATVEEVLWTLWDGTGWPRRLKGNVGRGGQAARLAHRDLDSVCALFDAAARAEEKKGHTSVSAFVEQLAAQQIPADTLAERGVRGEAVRLLTAHRSKGLEWRLVVAVGVQEGSWPNLQRRGSLLQADRIGEQGVLPPVPSSSLLAEERRLFYVAATRARERFVATAVQSTEEDGDQPSRFLSELGVDVPAAAEGRPARPLSLPGLVAELRRRAADPANPALQLAAAQRLATLAAVTDEEGRPLVPQAEPATWWGTRRRSVADRPLRDIEAPLTLSASALDGLVNCPTRWFLDREAAGSAGQTFAQGFGLVVHALADRVGKGELTDVDELVAHVDRVWDQLDFDTPWAREKQRAEVEAVIRRFVAWHNGRPDRTFLASEQQVEAPVTLPDGKRVILRGYVDRLELDRSGNVVVIDFKTSKNPTARDKVLRHAQLGLYQLAMDNGAATGLAGEEARSGGAELVQLRIDDQGMPKVQAQGVQKPDASGRRLAEVQLMHAADVLRSERLSATANDYCDYCSFQALCPVVGSGTVLS
jgi:superfamily I DNA/RNA helicase/RecB family exonuclease